VKLLLALSLIILFCLSAAAQSVSSTVTLTANAVDPIVAGSGTCGVKDVQFFNGTTAISPAITTPTTGNNYTFAWDTKSVPNGNYVITAKASDKAGIATNNTNTCDSSKPNIGTSNAINVTVNNLPADTNSPTITITITIAVVP
jgi:hypothetical protein